jgi:malate dehydrogenase
MKKIAFIGAGHVGETSARAVVAGSLAKEIVLIDIKDEVARGAALDIQQAAPLLNSDSIVIGTSDLQAIVGAEVVIVSAGLPRKPGMDRSELLESNATILDAIIEKIEKYAPQAILIISSNPADILTYFAWERMAWPEKRVIGLSGVLDSARMAAFIAMETGFSMSDIDTLVLGGHGDAMVPLPRYSCIRGIPISQFLSNDVIKQIVERTCKAGSEILRLKKHSSAYNAPAGAIYTMVEAIVKDKKRILPCISVLNGEFGYENIAMSVPCVVGADGIEKIIEIDLNKEETTLLKRSVDSIASDLEKLDMLLNRSQKTYKYLAS